MHREDGVPAVAADDGPSATAIYTIERTVRERCFAETGFCARGRFLAYWENHGGLAINGFPLSHEFEQVLEDGNTYTVQYFERVRMEHHPEFAAPNDVLLGQFGRCIHGGADPPLPPPTGPLPSPAVGPVWMCLPALAASLRRRRQARASATFARSPRRPAPGGAPRLRRFTADTM